jgi:hypothetical protein
MLLGLLEATDWRGRYLTEHSAASVRSRGLDATPTRRVIPAIQIEREA